MNSVKDKMKDAFYELDPSEGQKEEMWDRITSAKNKREKRGFSKFLAAAATIAIVFVAGFGVNLATDGAVVASILSLVGLDEDSQEILDQAVDIQEHAAAVYAPEIYYLDEEQVVFGGLRGLLVYDLAADALKATIDLQEIDSIYFNSDEKQTHVVMQDNMIYVYNTEAGNAFGDYYGYALEQEETVKLAVTEQANDAGKFEELQDAWEVQSAVYKDTFASLTDAYFLNGDCMYSANVYSWTDKDGTDYNSCLLVKEDGAYYIYHSMADGVTEEVPLKLELTEEEQQLVPEEEQEEVPAFQYQEEDALEAAICEYLVESEGQYFEIPKDGVMIPMLLVKGQHEADGVTQVYGRFFVYIYTKNGDILECTGGSSLIGRIDAKLTDGAYQVEGAYWLQEGSTYEEDMEALTATYPEVMAELEKGMTEEEHLQMKLDWIGKYVDGHQLEVKYFKEFGWDPVELK